MFHGLRHYLHTHTHTHTITHPRKESATELGMEAFPPVDNRTALLARIPGNGQKGSSFPGALPAGLRRLALQYLADPGHASEYLVTAKLDGLRMLALASTDGVFLVDRSLTVYDTQTAIKTAQDLCIFDGELMDHRYLVVFDAMVIDGTEITQEPYEERYRRVCQSLREMTVAKGVSIVPKRLYPWTRIQELTATFQPDGLHTFHVPISATIHPDWTLPCPSFSTDGLIWMNRTENFAFRRPFSLLKWKRLVTFDVLVDLQDLCDAKGRPRSEDPVPTYAWDYSVRLGRSQRYVFGTCRITPDERRLLWTGRRDQAGRWHEPTREMRYPRVVCIECTQETATTFKLFQGRLTKNRSNSTRTLQDTRRLAEEAVSLQEILDTVHRVPDDSEGFYVSSIGQSLQWLERAWGQAPECELELRLTYEGRSSLPPSMFYRTVERLQGRPNFLVSILDTEDYLSGNIRTTRNGYGVLSSIRKEPMYRCEASCAGWEPYGFRCVYSSEDPISTWDTRQIREKCTQVRRKHRWRFLAAGDLAIECTQVQTVSWPGVCVVTTFEMEIELLRSPGPESRPLGSRVTSLFAGMADWILDRPAETLTFERR